MPIVVEVPNRGSIEFADGTSDADIDAIVAKEFPPTQEDSYQKVLGYEQGAFDDIPSKDEYLAYLQAKKTKPLLGEAPLSTIGTAAVETGKMLATLPYRAGEAISETMIMPPEGVTRGQAVGGTAAEIAMQSRLGAEKLAGGIGETIMSKLDDLSEFLGGKARSDDDRYKAFLSLSDIKRTLARAQSGQVPAAQEVLQAYNIPQEAISPAGVEVGGFAAAPENIAFAGGGKIAGKLLSEAARALPAVAGATQRTGAVIGQVARYPETAAGRAVTSMTGSEAAGAAVESAIGKGTTGIALGEAAGIPIAGTLNIPGIGGAARAIGTAKAVGAGLETVGEAGLAAQGAGLSPIERGLLGYGERIAAQEGSSRAARALGTAIARTGLETPIKTAAGILVPAVGAGVAGGALAGLAGEEGDQVASAIGSGLAFGGIEAGLRMQVAAAKEAFNGTRVRKTALNDLNTRPNDVQFTYVNPVTKAEQIVTIADRNARAEFYGKLDNKQLPKALSEIANAENAGIEVIFHKDGDPVPTDIQQIKYAGVSINPSSVRSGKPTILINVDRAKPETIPHEILHARITEDMVRRVGSQIVEGQVNEAQFREFANKYADAISRSGDTVGADGIRNDLATAFDPTLQRAQRIEALRRMSDEFTAYYTQEFLAGKDPKTVLPGRIPSFFEAAFNKAKEAVAERFSTRALQSGFDPIARTFYDANGKRIKVPWMEDAIKQLIVERKGYEPREEKFDTRKLTPNQQAALIAARGYQDLFVLNPDGSIGRPLTLSELKLKDVDIANRTIQLLDSLPQADRGTVTGMDAKGNPVINGRLSLAEADALARSGIFSASTSRYISGIADAIQNGKLLNGTYWKVYGKTGKAGVFGESEKLFLPYAISVNRAGGVNIKVVDWGKVQSRMQTALQKQAYRNLFRSYDQAMNTLRDVYLKNIAEQNAVPSAEALGGGLDGAKKRNFFNEVMGAVPKKGDILINEPTAGYVAERKGGSVYQDLRIERLQNVEDTGFTMPWSGDMGEQSSYRRTQLNFQPAETIGETTVSTDQNAGYRILSKNGKFRLYGPDGSPAGIFDTQEQAKLKAEKDYATQARLQPEVDQQQRVPGDEGRQTAEAGGRNRALGGQEGQGEGGAVRQAGDVRFMPMSDLERSDLDLRISTRNPSAKKATENPLTQQLSIDLESITRTPGALPEIINTVGKYPGIKFERSGSMNRAKDFIRFVADNLIYLHDSVQPEIRDRSKLWYDGARKLTEDWSKRFDTTREGVAGVIASLSPQKDWYQNVTLAERVFEVVKTKQNEAFTGPLEQWARSKMTSGQSPKRLVQDEVINGMAGKKFSQLSDYEKAVFVRAFDEVNNTRTYPIVSPEGKMLDIARKADGTPATYAWGDFNSIAKAVKIAGDPTKKTISESLGYEHKVRSFYDNILLPNNPEHGDVTIDTHAVAAALMLPLAGSDVYVAHNFGQGVPGSSVYGTSGTYGIYADAYRLAAKERGILPREMQSITWEAVRGLFTPEFKTAGNKKLVENIWKEYKSGKATIDETRQRIVDTAGGIRNPSWFGSGGAAVAENAPAVNPRQLPSTGDLGGSGANAGGGGAVSGSGSQEVGAQRFMPSDTDYLSAVKKGDTAAAQRMVDEAAKAAGYTAKVFHGSISQFNKPNTPLFLGDEGTAASYAQDRAMMYGEGANPIIYKFYAKFKKTASESDVKQTAKDLGLQVENDMAYTALDPKISGPRYVSRVISELKDRGYDSATVDDFTPDSAHDVIKSFVAFDPSQLKLSDPVTRDSSGNVIPLSQRFKATSEDIRYMPQPDSAMPGAYSFPGGYRALPGKTKGSLRLYSPAGSLIGIAASLDEAQRIIRKKAKQ